MSRIFLGSHTSWNSLWSNSSSLQQPQSNNTNQADSSSSSLVSPAVEGAPNRVSSTDSGNHADSSPPKLFVLGTADQFTSVQTLQALLQASSGVGSSDSLKDDTPGVSTSCMPAYVIPERLQTEGILAASQVGATVPKASVNVELKVMCGCDHFFQGRPGEVADLVMQWVELHLT